MLELCVFVDGSGIHVPLAPRFRSVLGGKNAKQKPPQLETSGSFLGLKTKQINKQQKWAALVYVLVR